MSDHEQTVISPPVQAKNAVIRYFQESFFELKKVAWPTRNKAIRLTAIVIGFCIIFAIFIGAVDFVFNQGYRLLVDYSATITSPKAPVESTPVPDPNIQITPGDTPTPGEAPTPSPAPTNEPPATAPSAPQN